MGNALDGISTIEDMAMNNALILIIEDEPEIAEIIGTYMAREGFRVITAGDGTVGLAHHLRLRPNLVVLDIKLPGQDGYEVLAATRRRGDTPVTMVTALAEDLDKLQALRIGADDYVVKPFNPLEVVARAKAVLRQTMGRGGAEKLRRGPLSIEALVYRAVVESPAGPVPLELTRTESGFWPTWPQVREEHSSARSWSMPACRNRARAILSHWACCLASAYPRLHCSAGSSHGGSNMWTICRPLWRNCACWRGELAYQKRRPGQGRFGSRPAHCQGDRQCPWRRRADTSLPNRRPCRRNPAATPGLAFFSETIHVRSSQRPRCL